MASGPRKRVRLRLLGPFRARSADVVCSSIVGWVKSGVYGIFCVWMSPTSRARGLGGRAPPLEVNRRQTEWGVVYTMRWTFDGWVTAMVGAVLPSLLTTSEYPDAVTVR